MGTAIVIVVLAGLWVRSGDVADPGPSTPVTATTTTTLSPVTPETIDAGGGVILVPPESIDRPADG